MSRFDVAIVGAGPAGASLACRLARHGARVALIDGSHPREKPCGGGVTGRALALARDAVDGLDALRAMTIRAARFVDSNSGRAQRVPLETTDGRALVVASRRHFDALLLDAARRAGAGMIESRAIDVVRAGSEWRILTAGGAPLTAGVLVGADGANSLVRRRLLGAFRRDQLSIATGFFAHGATDDEILIELRADPPGYLWSFPRPDHLAIGICSQADAAIGAAELRRRTAQWVSQTGTGAGARLQPYSWPIPSLAAADYAGVEVARDGWMLVGDAAGLVDPITREGIFFALQSAAFAAEALAGAASQSARVYRERVRDEIGSELARAARFKAGFFRPAFIGLMLDALDSSDEIRRVMADLVAGTQPYSTLKWRLAGTLQIGLAWKLLTARSSRRAPAPAGSAVSR